MGRWIDNDKTALAELLRAGNLDAPVDERTPLMRFASSPTWSYEKKAGAAACVDNVRRLIDAGAKLEIRNRHGWTALTHAVRQRGAPEVVALLLERGADPNTAANDKLSPLHFAVERGKVSIVRMLLEAGARVDARSDWHGTPLDMAKKADIRKLLELAKAGRLKPGTKTPAAPKRAVLPAKLTHFLAKNARAFTGKRLAGLPGYARNAKVEVRFLKAPSLTLFTDNDIDPLAHPTYVPLARLDSEPQFLVVDVSKAALPVLMWEHEVNEFYKVAPSLEKLVARLR